LEKTSNILYCPGVLIGIACLGQAWILSRVFGSLREFLGIEIIHGLTAIIVKIDKSKYVLACIYSVDSNNYTIHDVIETKNCLIITDKVFGARSNALNKCLKEIGIKPFSIKPSLLKTSFKCLDKYGKICVVTSGLSREYSLTYLLLSTNCYEKSINIKTISIIEDLIDLTLHPVSKLLINKCIEKRLEKEKCDEILNTVNKNFLIYLTELISRNTVKPPSDLDFNDIINYVKSIVWER